jgi:hypothetical protein
MAASRPDHTGIGGDLGRELEDRRAVLAGQHARSQNDHRPLGICQHFREIVIAAGDLLQHCNVGAQLLRRIGEIDRRADIGDP